MTYEEARAEFSRRVKAAETLAKAVDELGIDISIATISMIRSGARRPSWKLAGAIEARWSIPVAAWMRAPKRRASKRKAA